jgi:mannose-6-phosphate isomerase
MTNAPLNGAGESVPLTPLTFAPVFKDYPWGGRNLAAFGRSLPDGIVAESWDVAAHPNGSSPVRSGPLAGKTLPELMELWGIDLVGERNAAALDEGRFPLLIKLLDAQRWLSVQVHPDDTYAFAHEGEPGKTEMWVVLKAAPGAKLLYGFDAPIDRAGYAQAIAEGRSDEPIHRLPVAAGDVIFVPPGTIHALGEGIVVAEIQQNSDTTYRIYDWGRDRPLHIEQSLDVLNYAQVRPQAVRPTLLLDDEAMRIEQLVSCPYFEVQRLVMPAEGAFFGVADGESFEIFGVLEGRATLHWEGEPLTLDAVDWVLVPAGLGEFEVVADQQAALLRVFVPDADVA